MKLVWHQFRKDVRQFRRYLAVWFVLLVSDFAVSAGWVGNVACDPVRGFNESSSFWAGPQSVVMWILFGVLISMVVLTDSPARREGFLGTRPLPGRDLFLAKALFVLLLLLMPVVAQEFIYLLWSDLPIGIVVHGTLERLVVILPLAVAMAAFASLWRSYASWAGALAGLFGGGYVVLGLVALVAHFGFGVNLDPDTGGGSVLVASFLAAAALIVMAVWQARAAGRMLWRWLGLSAVAGGFLLIALFAPVKLFSPRPSDPAAAAAIASQGEFRLPSGTMHIAEDDSEARSDRLVFSVSVAPELDPVPKGDLVEWIATDARLVSEGREVLPRGRNRAGNAWHLESSDNVKNIEAWSSVLEGEPLVRGGLFLSQGGRMNAGSFQLREDDLLLTESTSLKLRLEGRVFRWQKLAELPLTPGARAKDDYGEWRFIMNQGMAPGQNMMIERKQVNLSTTPDYRRQNPRYGNGGRLAMALYHPGRGIAIMPDHFYGNLQRASHTAYSRTYITAHFSQFGSWRPISPEELKQCRLIIFEKIWLGIFPKAWESPSFVLRDRVQRWVGNMRDGEHQLSRADFERRLDELIEPVPGATREEVSRYLLEFLRLVDARGAAPSRRGTERLAALVPNHLELMLDGLPAMAGLASHDVVIAAIAEGATEAQKDRIIAAIPTHPNLASVLFRRGWVSDARPELFKLTESGETLPTPALQAIAWFEDPQTYPRLLSELQRWRNEAVYDTVRSLPGIESQLDAMIDRQLQRLRPVVRQEHMVADSVRLGLLHGRPEALDLACRVAAEIAPDQTGNFHDLGQVLQRTVNLAEMSPPDRSDPARVVAWLQQHRANEFVFDPARRQFVLTNAIVVNGVNVPASNPSRP